MKIFTILAALALAAGAFAAEAPTWARVYYDSTVAMERDILAQGFDVCSGRAGEYVDVIASGDDLAGLQDLGYRIEVLSENAFAGIDALPPDLGLYHTYQEMLDELQQYAAAYPNICRLNYVGYTWENRNIWRLRISDYPDRSEPQEPKLYVVGNHHARELMTVEIPLYFIKTLLEGYTKDAGIKYYVDNYEIDIIPMANPDGHVYVENHSGGSPNWWWRKNRRNNGGGSYGVDLNRNYGYKWGYDDVGSSPNPGSNVYRGPAAFSEPETTALRSLMSGTDFLFGMDYHSYGEYILLPWGYLPASQSHTPEHSLFMEVGNGMNTQLGNRYRVGTIPEMLYRVNGDSSDYYYGEQTEKAKTYGIGFEVNHSFAPPESEIDPTVKEQKKVLLWLLEYMRQYLTGVELSDFEGHAREGRAVLSWATGREYNHAGFNLYREEAGAATAAGSRIKVNDGLITGTSPYRFVDDGVAAARAYDYYLEDVTLSGETNIHGPARVDMGGFGKAAFALGQNAPNPARRATTVTFSLASPGDVTLTIYDLAGRKVMTAFAGAAAAGDTAVAVDVSALAPGVYTYRLEGGPAARASRKMVVVK